MSAPESSAKAAGAADAAAGSERASTSDAPARTGGSAAAPSDGPSERPAQAPTRDKEQAPAKAQPVAAAKPGQPAAAKPNPAPAAKTMAVVANSETKPKAAAPAAKPKPVVTLQEPASAPVAPAAPALNGSTSSAAQAARDARRAHARRVLLRFALWVGLPTLLSIVYFTAIAHNEYESEASFMALRKEGPTRAALVQEYLRSRELLETLEQGQKFSAHYQSVHDPIRGLSSHAGSESRYVNFREHVQTEFDAATGIGTLRVRAFSGAFAAEIAKQVLSSVESRMSATEERNNKRMLASAEGDLTQAQQRVLALEHQAEQPDGKAQLRFSPELELARQEAKAALDALSNVRASVRSHDAPLIVIAKPSRPDEPTYPRRLRGVLSVFLVALCLFGIGSLLVAAVREHAQF